jgi:SAM-dependent methyltransferase
MFSLYAAAVELNKRNIVDLVKDGQFPVVCDLGCNDGEWTKELAGFAHADAVFGVEIVDERARMAQANGVNVAISNLASGLPFDDESFDLVHANQVIEHLTDIDQFLSETNRVLKRGGAAVISTENGSSWHNIFAAAMGWQIFSLTNVSGIAGAVGNPLALHRGKPALLPSWTHKTIFNYGGLLDILRAHRLNPVRVLGAGYYPLPARVGRMDARHAHLISVKAIKAT